MSADLAATPGNFDAHLSSVGNTPASGSDDGGGSRAVRDNTGPSNDNSWSGEVEAPDPNHVNPEQRARGDAKDDTLPADYADVPDLPEEPAEDGEVQAEGEEGDEQQPQQEGMPAYEQLQEMYQALQTPELHEGLYDKLIPVTVNGVQVHKPISEVKEGYMRMSDYSRGKQEAAAETRAARTAVENNRMFLQRMADPKILRATLRRLGPQHEQAFHAAAEEYAGEFLALKRMSPTERRAHERAQEAERKAEQYEEMARRAQQQKPEPQEDQRQQLLPQLQAVLQQHFPGALAQYQLQDNGVTRERLQYYLKSDWDQNLETLPQAIYAAAHATADDMADLVRRLREEGHQAPQPRQAPQALPPRRMPAGAPPRPAPGQRQGGRVSDFSDFLKGR